MQPVRIGSRLVGPGQPTFIVAEVGINHNGNVELARKLVHAAVASGCDAVKFQKRTVEAVYSAEDLARPRESPFGTTNGDLKRGLEFGLSEYTEIDAYCGRMGIPWFASCWDEASVDFMKRFDPPCWKIASASLTDVSLLKHHRNTGRPLLLSTGMSSLAQIDEGVRTLEGESLILLHCTSTYPTRLEEINLRAIPRLQEHFGVPVGYSGHEVGLSTTLGAVALGACLVERHISLDRAMWGSDQAASVEPQGFARLVKDIRAIETAMGDGTKRIYDSEIPIMEKLRRR
jgi:N-acetylneuraminate synthase